MASKKREAAMSNAKSYLTSRTDANGLSVYDHMTKMLQQFISERPKDPMDVFDHVSDRINREGFVPPKDTLKDEEAIPSVLPVAQHELAQIMEVATATAEASADEVETLEDAVANILETGAYFQHGGIGLAPEELYRIFVALKHLSQTKPFLDKVRFWGKMFGLGKNYVIAEAELKSNTEEEVEEGEEGKPEEAVQEDEQPENDDGEVGQETVQDKKKKQLLPVPPEDTGSGCNVKIYYFCQEPGAKWQRLPNVKPEHIAVARKIKKYLTGDPKAEIVSYPPFPGNEANYMRAQIARISASTIISPAGYYSAPDEEEEEGEDAPDTVEVNPEYEPLSTQELIDSMANWVHHIKYILPQGRCKWFNQMPDADEDFDDEDEDDNASRSSEGRTEPKEPETGPPMLNPVTEDTSPALGSVPAWTTRKVLTILPQHAHVVLQSNLWPGAYTAGTARNFENMYIGYGHKYTREPFSPELPPIPQKEVSNDPSIVEASDPTVEEEEAAKKKTEDDEEEGEEDGEEEEEEDDD